MSLQGVHPIFPHHHLMAKLEFFVFKMITPGQIIHHGWEGLNGSIFGLPPFCSPNHLPPF